MLGALRPHLAQRFELIPEGAWAFAWVVDFPAYHFDADEQRWVAEHHVFTAPRPEHEALLESDPGAVLSQAYDLVINGHEAGGGSIRINRPDLQERALAVVGITAEEAEARFGFLLRALRFGAPPHGGIAHGPRPLHHAAGRHRQHSRRDRLPEGRRRHRPADRRADAGRPAAARRARPRPQGRAPAARRRAMRPDGRRPDELRPVTFEVDFIRSAKGSVLVTQGGTRVICTASVEESVPGWMRGRGTGWVTAEYGMLPASTS